jgi:hypothetical protein
MNEQETSEQKAKGGRARAESLSPEQRKAIAQKAASVRWKAKNDPEGIPKAKREGILTIGEIDLECYVLEDGRRLIHKRGLAKALGLKSAGGNAFMKLMGRKGLGSVMTDEMRDKLGNPCIFKPKGRDPGHGYEGTFLIDVCDTIWEARKQERLTPSQYFISLQAEAIVRSSAKVGIIALIDEATGYIKDKRKDEYRELFKEFIRNECKEWDREFPDQFFDIIYKIYNLRRNKPNKHPQFFGNFIRKYVYAPLANSNGAILDMLDEKNPVVYINGGRRYKMFQFLTEVLGIPTFKAHLWQLIGIGNASRTKEGFDRMFKAAFPEAGYQMELFDPEL